MVIISDLILLFPQLQKILIFILLELSACSVVSLPNFVLVLLELLGHEELFALLLLKHQLLESPLSLLDLRGRVAVEIVSVLGDLRTGEAQVLSSFVELGVGFEKFISQVSFLILNRKYIFL